MGKKQKLSTRKININNFNHLKYIFDYNINIYNEVNEYVNTNINNIINELNLINSLGTFDNNNNFIQYVSNDLSNCMFYYEDENNNIIDNFLGINYEELNSFNKYNIAPYLAKKIGVYDNDNRIGEISLGHLKVNFNDRLYRVGLVSDMHYNDTSIDSNPYTVVNIDGSEYDTDLENALNYYQNNQEVLFICGAGDVSTDSKDHLRNFALNLRHKAPDTPLYTCLGNHDFQATHYETTNTYSDGNFDLTDEYLTRMGIWNSLITPNDDSIHFFDANSEEGKLSYYFERNIPGTNKTDIYLFLSIDYGVTHKTRTTKSTWDCKGAQKMLDYNDNAVSEIMQYLNVNNRNETQQQYDYQFYNNDVLLWVKNIIEQNKNKRIFLFTHQFFIQKAGNNNGLKYYSYAADYWRISQKDEDQIAYCLCGLQFEFLNKLNNDYTNVIWFSGHSHYSWKWQIIDKTINICAQDYPIIDPKDNDFNKELRYFRKHNYTNLIKHKFNELYLAYTNIGENRILLEKIINNIDNGIYHIKFIAEAAYTPDRGFRDYDKENQSTSHIEINNTNINILSHSCTFYSYDDYNVYEVEFEVTNNEISLKWINDINYANWFIINVLDIYNTNESILQIFDEINYYSNYNNIKVSDTEYAPITKINNLCQPTNDSAFNIHLPSLARPIPYNVNTYKVELQASEGAIMDVYENYIDIRGIIFKDKDNYINKYYPLSQYRLNI